MALVVVFAAVFATGTGTAATSHTSPVNGASVAAAVPSSTQPMLTRDFKGFTQAYRSHRPQFARVSDYSQRVRGNWMAGLFAFAVFVLLTLPVNTRGVRAFYRQMMEAAPLTTEESVTEENNRQARKVLFFYLIFLLYQLAEYPLTFGHGNHVQFVTDFVIQTGLVLAIAWAFHDLKHGMREQWKNDPERQDKMNRWLNQRLAGMRIRWRDISKLAVAVFIAGFTPALLSHLTGWLDALTDFGKRLLGS